MITEWEGGSLLRVEPARKGEDRAEFECVAENGVGDPVSATARLTVYESNGAYTQSLFSIRSKPTIH